MGRPGARTHGARPSAPSLWADDARRRAALRSVMRVTMILPALTEATSPLFRPVKYSLFPPLGLATLAGHLDPDDDVMLLDEHVQRVTGDDNPDLVVIQAYITSAYRCYQLADQYRARGVYVCLGGLHPTALPEEAARHADTVITGPGEGSFPDFLADFRAGHPLPRYQGGRRSLAGIPPIRRDLIRRELYLVPNSLTVSRGCPHKCEFCYVSGYFGNGIRFYTQAVDDALAEIESLPGRHLYFLDDHLFGNPRFAQALFEGMRGMGRLFQGAATVSSLLRPGLLEAAAEAGLRSIFVGFETLSEANLAQASKAHNAGRDYAAAVRRAHDLGMMVNGSFVFGLDDDDPDVFTRTVEWAVATGIETATFHIATPYPGTPYYEAMKQQGRLLHSDWSRYDTRHAVFVPAAMTTDQLEQGYWSAYRDFYSWRNIARGAAEHDTWEGRLRHFGYASGWKKFEPLWDVVIRARRIAAMRPALERVLAGRDRHPRSRSAARVSSRRSRNAASATSVRSGSP